MSEHTDELYTLAQKDVVALCLFRPDCISQVMEVVSTEFFLDEQCSLVMNAIVDVARSDQKVSPLSVMKNLEESGNLKGAGGLEGVYELYTRGKTAAVANPPQFIASVVRESYVKHTIREAVEESVSDFESDSAFSTREAVEKIQSTITEMALPLNDDSAVVSSHDYVKTFDDVLNERKRIAEENKEVSGGLQGIPTLLPSLNKYTSGFTPGQLVTIGAGTGVGKSVFAIMSAIAAIEAKKSVLFFSLEMSESEIFDRMYANMAEVPLNQLKTGEVNAEQRARIDKASARLESSTFLVDANPGATVDYIRSKAIRQQQRDEGLDMVIVDYLQLISASSRFNSRQEFIADASRNMKLLAKTLKIPVMVLVQLNRPKDGEDEAPTLDRIRESGAVAQDSDIVIFLHKEKAVDNRIPHTLIMLEKNRNGESKKTIRCHSELAYSDFREVKKADLGEQSHGDNEESSSSSVDDFYGDTTAPDFDDSDADDFFDA